jgi:hypothetical protein
MWTERDFERADHEYDIMRDREIAERYEEQARLRQQKQREVEDAIIADARVALLACYVRRMGEWTNG